MTLFPLLQHAADLGLFRSLDIQFAMMVEQEDPATVLAAAILSRDTGEGHVCLPLERLTVDACFSGSARDIGARLFAAVGNIDDWSARLRLSAAVGDDEAATPIKLINDRLYLNRMWRYEARVAAFFRENNAEIVVDEGRLRTILDGLFPADKALIDWQKVAAVVALTRRISVISGGPGTGKTTTVAKLLAALVQLSPTPLRIRLAAPTGKAAARLTESLGGALRKLPLTEEQKALLPDEAGTLHRLLGVQPGSQRLRYHQDNPLHLDVLVVDEASMVDLTMMAKLLAALPEHARVIFLGDRDQLASVEAGAVLGDICHFIVQGFSPRRAEELSRLSGCPVPAGDVAGVDVLRDAICLLQESYRFDRHSGIGFLARAVNDNQPSALVQAFSGQYPDISLHHPSSTEEYARMLDEVVTGHQDFWAALQQGADPSVVLQAFSRYQLLCALREGPFGVVGLNERIEQAIFRQRIVARPAGAARWYHGRPVMITRNDSSLGLFNGDIGITLAGETGLRVWFTLPDGSLKSVLPGRLPGHETAWAMTVHKSQGSEFEHVLLALPQQFTPVVTRELVYTAITRAKSRLSLWTEQTVLTQAIRTRTARRSGLLAAFSSVL